MLVACAVAGFAGVTWPAAAVHAELPQAYRDHSRAAHDGSILAVVQPRDHAVVLFDTTPTTPRPVFAFGRYGRQAGAFVRPTGIAIDAQRGLIFVSDTDNDRIEVFQLARGTAGDIRAASFVKAVGRAGAGPGELSQPAGLALDHAGNLYVCDTGNARVQVFDAKLNFLREWGRGDLAAPATIAIDESAGTVYVSDLARLQLRTFTPGGETRATWGQPRDPVHGLARGEVGFPFGLSLASGLLFVSDARRQDVQTFRGNALVSQWGRSGSEDGRFFQPEGIAVLDASRVFVIDQGGHRGQIFTPDGRFTAAFPIPAGDLYPWPTPGP